MAPACRMRLLLVLGCAVLARHGVAAEEKQPSEKEMAEYKQDFLDFDQNRDEQIDAQEVRAQFKGDLDPKELHQFFLDTDKDNSGTVTMKEYIDYAVTLG
mmetsp:Transcript_76073/g.215116  ORF Transcript_76073/g.215116 Transcript_76073/m.215116 type:complete len:100 (-) Transcript_76073:211-510(-)